MRIVLCRTFLFWFYEWETHISLQSCVLSVVYYMYSLNL